jgi:hypothetical protein
MSRRLWKSLLFLLVYLSSGLWLAGEEGRTGELDYQLRLQILTRGAGTIFGGTVTSVRRLVTTKPNELETIEISFRVEQGVRGAQRGQALTIREWAGLWTAGERYQPGERVFLFLYPPSRLGLTSPVGGPQGRFAVDAQRRVLLVRDEPGNSGLAPANTQNPALAAEANRQRVSKTRVSLREFTRAIRRAAEE